MKIKLEDIEGKWYIQFTNFPMWLKGDKKSPAIKYQIDKKWGRVGLTDKVTYYKNGKFKRILGFDFPQNAENTKMKWRGNGWLLPITSKWEISHLKTDQKWMHISFSQSLFTPAGHDILTMQEKPEPKVLHEIEEYRKENGLQDLVQLQ